MSRQINRAFDVWHEEQSGNHDAESLRGSYITCGEPAQHAAVPLRAASIPPPRARTLSGRTQDAQARGGARAILVFE